MAPQPPVVILVRPQLGVNIGAAARAMMNTGLCEMRLVAPREPWPNEHALPAAGKASVILDAAKVFPDVAAATADLSRVYATTWRDRGLVKWVVTPRQAATELRAYEGRAGVLFGPERTGLANEDLAPAQAIVTVPLNPEHPSLNLAQAVLLVGYEWWMAGDTSPPRALERNHAPPATAGEMANFMARLVQHLDEGGFLYPPEKRAGMIQNLEALFGRLEPTGQELNTLHGVVKALRSPRQRG